MGLVFLTKDIDFVYYDPVLGWGALALVAIGIVVALLSLRLLVKFLKEKEF